MKKITLMTALLLVASLPAAAQTTGSGSLTFNATIEGVVTVAFDGSALTSGSGTNAAVIDLGNISKPLSGYTTGSGVVVAPNATDWSISAPFDLIVNQANTGTTQYGVVVTPSAALPAGTSWSLNLGAGAVAVPNAGASFSALAYGSRAATLAVTLQDSMSPGALNVQFDFVATAGN